MPRTVRPPVQEAPGIADYAFISDCRSAALIARNGSVDWCCMPRFDAGSCFGHVRGGKPGRMSMPQPPGTPPMPAPPDPSVPPPRDPDLPSEPDPPEPTPDLPDPDQPEPDREPAI